MKLLCLPSLLVCCFALTEAADFKHFPVQAGRQDSAKTDNRGAPSRHPVNRERGREGVRKHEGAILDPAGDYSDEDEDVPQVRVTSTTQRIRVNRNRNKSRTRISTNERKVETTAKPARKRTRIRTAASRLKASPRRQRPTVDISSPTTVGFKETDTQARIPKTVIKQAFKQAEETFAMDPFQDAIKKPAFPIPKLVTNLPSEQASKTFSQSLTGLFHPEISPTVNPFSEERQKQILVEGKTHTKQQSFEVTQNQQPLQSVRQENQEFTFQAQPQSSQAQTFQPQPFRNQPFPVQARAPQSVRLTVQPPQQQPASLFPIRQAEVFSPIQQQVILPPGRPNEVFPPKPIQLLSQAPNPTFQDRPSLFSTPIEFPKQEGAGASFSYSAIVG